jgi:hypothetical protein
LFADSVELEDRVDADFPHPLRDQRRLGAENDFALVFVAAQFALDSNVGTPARVATNSASLPIATHRCHSVQDSRVPASSSATVLSPARRPRSRCAADFLFGIAARGTGHSDSVKVHTFSCSARLSRAPRKRVGAAPKTRSCFSGGTGIGGARTGTGPTASSSPRRRRAPQEPRSSAETAGGN